MNIMYEKLVSTLRQWSKNYEEDNGSPDFLALEAADALEEAQKNELQWKKMYDSISQEVNDYHKWINKEYNKIPNIFKREEFGNNKLIEGQYSIPELEYLSNSQWIWTEKVDGTNIRIIWDGHEVTFGGRTSKAQIPAHLVNRLNELFSGTNKEEIFEQHFGDTPVILFGEGYGEKIQKGGGLYGSVDFILFDVFCNGVWLRRDDVEDIAKYFEIKVVPIVGRGDLKEAVEYIRNHPQSFLKNDELEGIVCRPSIELNDRRGNRIIVKIKCRDFQKE